MVSGEVMSCLLSYQENAMNRLNRICDFRSLRVLEIGGSPPGWEVGREFLRRGADTVICINNREDVRSEMIHERLEVHRMDARAIDLASESFDIVFGTAVLEHLQDLDLVLKEIGRVLKRNGIVYLHGGPIWSCCLGHHLWVFTDEVFYKFNDSNNPIPNWYHLILSGSEMRALLLRKKLSNSHANQIVEMIYDSDLINRYIYEDYIRILSGANLLIVRLLENCWGTPDPDVMKMLHKSGRDVNGNYHTGAVDVIMEKSKRGLIR